MKGKYYINERLKYDGEYLFDNKYNDKGYDEYGNKIYELRNGTGNGKEYFPNGKLIFEGEYLNGRRNGKGKEYENGKLILEGEYKSDKRWNCKAYDEINHFFKLKEGKGLLKIYDNNGKLKFENEYLNGEKNGKGKVYYNGKGKEYYDNGKLKFEGEYLYDYRLKGKYYIDERLEYEGEYLNKNKYNGKGYD